MDNEVIILFTNNVLCSEVLDSYLSLPSNSA